MELQELFILTSLSQRKTDMLIRFAIGIGVPTWRSNEEKVLLVNDLEINGKQSGTTSFGFYTVKHIKNMFVLAKVA